MEVEQRPVVHDRYLHKCMYVGVYQEKARLGVNGVCNMLV